MKTGRHIDIMGIVNLTDDSYFAQSRCKSVDAVLRRTHQMVSDGAGSDRMWSGAAFGRLWRR